MRCYRNPQLHFSSSTGSGWLIVLRSLINYPELGWMTMKYEFLDRVRTVLTFYFTPVLLHMGSVAAMCPDSFVDFGGM